MLGDLESNVDRTDSKLGDAMRRMRRFVRQTEGIYVRMTSILSLTHIHASRNEVWLVHHYSDYHPHGSSAISYSSMTFLGLTSFLAYGLEYTTQVVLEGCCSITELIITD